MRRLSTFVGRPAIVLLLSLAGLLASAFVATAQSPTPCVDPLGVDCPTPTPTPSPTPPCIPGLTCPDDTPSPKPTRTPKPTAAPTRTPRRTFAPSPSATTAAGTSSPSPTPLPTASPSPTPAPAPAPNRGLATLGLIGSAAMIAASAWIWRRYLS